MMVSYGVCKGVTLYKSRWHREKFKLVLDRNVRDGLFCSIENAVFPIEIRVSKGVFKFFDWQIAQSRVYFVPLYENKKI